MSNKNGTSLVSELPAYLGLGKLEPNSIQSVKDGLIASYLQDGDLVYQVHLQSKQVRLEEYYQQKVISQTVGGSLKETFLRHFASLETYKNLRFRDVFQPLMGQSNIYVNLPSRFSMGFYPAGAILGLRMPLEIDKSKEWLRVRPNFETNESPLNLETDQQGFLFYLMENGEVKGDPVLVLEFTALLLNITEAIQQFIKTGLIGKSKEKRLVITDCTQIGQDALSIYLGDQSKGILTYTFLQIPPKKKTEVIAQQFFEHSVQFLEMLKK